MEDIKEVLLGKKRGDKGKTIDISPHKTKVGNDDFYFDGMGNPWVRYTFVSPLTTYSIRHHLDRAPQTWIAARKNEQCNVWETQDPDTTYIYLRCDRANATVWIHIIP